MGHFITQLFARILYALLSSSMPRQGRKRRKTRYFFFQEGFDCWLLLPEVTLLSHTLSNILVVIRTHVKARPEDGANTEENTYNPPKSFIVRHGRVGPEVLSLISCTELRSILLREP